MEEMNVLEAYLRANGYEYNRHALTVPGETLAVYDCDSKYDWDVSYGIGTIGYESGLLEGCGSIFGTDDDIVEGNLTAQDVIDRLETLVITENE